MSTELLRQIVVRQGSVFLESKSNNDDYPFHLWKSEDLNKVFQREGQRGLNREIVIMLSEYADIDGSHHSVTKYRSCLQRARALQNKRFEKIKKKREALAPADNTSLHTAHETPAAQAYRQFEQNARLTCNEQLAQLADQLTAKPSQCKGDTKAPAGNLSVQRDYL